MQKINKFLYSILFSFFLYACKTTKEVFYSYKVESYTIDSVKSSLRSSSLISYGDYLFEFIERTTIRREQYGNSDPVISSIQIDTVGVYLLEDKNKLYYEFDTFALKTYIVKIGKLEDKERGVRLTPSVITTPATEVFYKPPEETLINNIKCFYTEVASKSKDKKDTFQLKMTLIKNVKFNSLYKINGVKFTDKDYCIVGLNIYYPKQKQGYSEEINVMRPLTEKEEKICESMVVKSKTSVMDTIKGMSINDKTP